MATEGGGARAVLTVDLGAIVANWQRLRQEAGGVEVAAVVKADGYGLGAPQVAGSLHAAGCRRFFVARPAEGVALREHLPGVPIYILDGVTSGVEEELAAAGLVPVLNHPGQLAGWAALARRQGVRLPAAIQIDTGMCRLGFAEAELGALDRGALEALDFQLVMSHLAIAEQPGHPLNARQAERFERLRPLLPAAPSSLANSSGIFLGPAFHHQLCRPGVALYGVNPTPCVVNPMRPVVTLTAAVLQVHEVSEPGSVGYGATFATRRGMRIATVPVGYADGFLRAAGSRGSARIGGYEVPLAGRVSMDLITLDVSAVPRQLVHPGAEVELIGGPDGVDRLAAAAGTIGYEILTRLGTRFARRYIPAGPASETA